MELLLFTWDFAKAFDSVVHTKLIAKLRCYGTCDMKLCWIESFLSNYYQFVRNGSSVISACSVWSGVPQGSVLGSVHVYDIAGCMAVTVSIELFADDAKIYTVISDGNSTQLQSSLDAVVLWADHWQLKLSPIKHSVMRIAFSHSFIGGPVYKIAHFALPVLPNVQTLESPMTRILVFRRI
jgi:ribonucleases P/MRP protein subunit RPP40